jgi:hypothetical protein
MDNDDDRTCQVCTREIKETEEAVTVVLPGGVKRLVHQKCSTGVVGKPSSN